MEKTELEQQLLGLRQQYKTLYEQMLRTEGAIQVFQHLLAEHEQAQAESSPKEN